MRACVRACVRARVRAYPHVAGFDLSQGCILAVIFTLLAIAAIGSTVTSIRTGLALTPSASIPNAVKALLKEEHTGQDPAQNINTDNT